jgi:hypothetical protein
LPWLPVEDAISLVKPSSRAIATETAWKRSLNAHVGLTVSFFT